MKLAKKKLTFFRYIGGKHFLAKLIVELIPEHEIYVEPFLGAGHVFFAKERSRTEVLNDANSKIANLFYCVAFHYKEFWSKFRWLVYSRAIRKKLPQELKKKETVELGDVDSAVGVFFLLNTDFGGNLYGGFGYSANEGGGKAKRLKTAMLRLRCIHKRLLGDVFIECLDFEDVMDKWDRKETFFYCDPPYYGAEHYYEKAFSKEDHLRLLNRLKQAKGKWILSGYHNELYDAELKGFPYVEIDVPKPSYGITVNSKRKNRPRTTEVLWFNYEPDPAVLQKYGLELKT
jgi:DNA adenine methylase